MPLHAEFGSIKVKPGENLYDFAARFYELAQTLLFEGDLGLPNIKNVMCNAIFMIICWYRFVLVLLVKLKTSDELLI